MLWSPCWMDSDQRLGICSRSAIPRFGYNIIPFLWEKWEDSFNPVFKRDRRIGPCDLHFSLLKLQDLSDCESQKDRALLTAAWIIKPIVPRYLISDKLNAEMHQIYFEVWTAFSNDLQPFVSDPNYYNVYSTLRFSANNQGTFIRGK